jgi:uncharacterized protein
MMNKCGCPVAYADFQGNRQYLSVGNLAACDRISMILVDYPNRRRLKIWGHARIFCNLDEPEFLATLSMPGYRAKVERGIVISIAAIDWNCSQHITPRYTETRVMELLSVQLEDI